VGERFWIINITGVVRRLCYMLCALGFLCNINKTQEAFAGSMNQKIPEEKDEKEIPEAPSGSIFIVNKGELNLYLSCQALNDIINGVVASLSMLVD